MLKVKYLDVELINQPANSPDFNVNDLGFFRALQSKHFEHTCSNVDELIASVTKANGEYPPAQLNKIWLSLNKIWLSLQNCMIETTAHEKGCTYSSRGSA